MLHFSPFLLAFRFDNLVFEMLAGMAFGLYLFWEGFHALQRRRLILDTPASTVRSAAMGLVEVNGLACGPATIMAPISGLACYYYCTTAWQYKQSGRNEQWVQVARESSHVPFYLDDNTGRVLINPEGADMDIHCDFKEEYSNSVFSTLDAIPENVRDFLVRYNVTSNHKTRVEERCIKPKNALFILGTLADNIERLGAAESQTQDSELSQAGDLMFSAAASAGSASQTGTSSPGHAGNVATVADPSKVAAALVKAGIASPAAWQAAGIGPAEFAAAAANSGTSADHFDPNPKIVLAKGPHNSTFLISWRSQREVANSLEWKCSLMIWGGPAITLSCLYLLAAYSHWL